MLTKPFKILFLENKTKFNTSREILLLVLWRDTTGRLLCWESGHVRQWEASLEQVFFLFILAAWVPTLSQGWQSCRKPFLQEDRGMLKVIWKTHVVILNSKEQASKHQASADISFAVKMWVVVFDMKIFHKVSLQRKNVLFWLQTQLKCHYSYWKG